MTQTNIHCGCGAKINTNEIDLIDKFDKVHGSLEHQNKVLDIKLAKVKGNG
jgi:hypothetical protein